MGANLDVINGGTIGIGAGGTAPAIAFTGGLNSLTLYAGSAINGTVVAASAADRFILGGSADGTFSVAAIGSQYQSFGIFQKTGSSTWTLTDTTAAVTPWQILGGTLSISSDGNLGAASGGVLLDGGILRATATLGTARTFTLGTSGGTIQTNQDVTLTAVGVFVGSGGLTKGGPGTLTLSGANSYTGPTLVQAGTLAGGAANAFSAASAFTVAGGAVLDLGGFGQTIASLAGSGRVSNNGAQAVSLTTGGGNSSTTFAGVFADGTSALGLTKAGTGTFTLAGANSYGGGTLVAGGTLVLTNPQAAGTGAIAMDEGTRLAFLGSGYTLQNAIRFTGQTDPTIDSGPGTIGLAGTISGPGSLEKAGSGTLSILGNATYTGSTLVSAGILQVDGSIASSPLTTVAPDAGLSGTGRLGALSVQSGGFVAPGNAANPTGTLTAEGPVAFGAGSALATTVAQTAASRLVTPLTASIAPGGILQITPTAAVYTTPIRLPILVASSGLTGQFTSVTYTAPIRGLQPTVGYDANEAYIQFGDTTPTPAAPTQDLTSAITSAQALARDRIGAFVTQRMLGSVLTGFNQQISCGSCFSGFGLAGSYSVGAQGRRALNDELIAIGGFAYSGYDSGKVHVSGAPIFAGLLRYDPAGLGSARPFVDVGGLFAPSQVTTYDRTYTFGDMLGSGVGRTSNIGGSVFGRVGYVARLTPRDEIAGAVEYSRGWQYVGAYTESQLVPNPYPLVNNGGTDVINIAKIGGQYTHLFGTSIEGQVNLGVSHGFGLTSGLNGTVAGVAFPTPLGSYTWAEYGARVSYRVKQDLALDAFILGTLGPRPIGDTIHGGASVRYAF
ncbi:autotransporter-associated beta strand repeat-containing protein [Methylobacterium sp. E-016]|nr:autotransporter-associated beta strand repeat-containing protein [Methylobacterium sp. E-016]